MKPLKGLGYFIIVCAGMMREHGKMGERDCKKE
jgi:hypothetical protein